MARTDKRDFVARPNRKPSGPREPKTDAKVSDELTETKRTVKAAARILAIRKARQNIIPFTQLMMPDPNDPDDALLSRYDVQHFHTLVAEALEKVEKGEILRLILIMPPRHGKSQLASRSFGAWYIGRNPYNSIILTSYNDELATDVGNDVRAMLQSPMYAQIFPNCHLRKGSKAVDRMQTVEGGMMVFVGGQGTITGRGGDVVIIDDPIKNSSEADSPTLREKAWRWFTQDVMSRMMSDMGAIIIIMTRWHEDDIVGRLTDPKNPCFREDEAQNWKILHLPALAEANDPLRRRKDEALWEARHSEKRLKAMRRINTRGFNANYQGRPTPDDGEFFKRDWLVPYALKDLPSSLRIYCSSDHAVGLKQENDRNCLLTVGVDDKDVMWVLPDLYWERSDTESTVEAMVGIMERHRPLTWWGENEHIFKSIGPFLFKRMRERNVFCSVEGVSPAKDKRTRAQAIRGRMSMRMVRFPTFAHWWGDALDEILKFDRGRHDDFVDALAHIGMGLGQIIRAPTPANDVAQEPRTGTFAWIKWNSQMQKRHRALQSNGGM